MPWLWLVLLLAFSVSGQLVDAHGYMEEPKARNWLNAGKLGFYDQMSLNQNRLPFPAGICGGQYVGDTRFSVRAPGATGGMDGVFAKGVIVAQYTQGQAIRVTIKQTAAHYGRFELRLCPLSDASMLTEYRELSDACFDANRLFLAPNSTQPGLSNPSGAPERYHYFTVDEVKNLRSVTAWFVLPPGVTCARCVLQMRWVTGNSCHVPGITNAYKNSYAPFLPACNPTNYLQPAQSPPEKFWNCADIAIRGPTPKPNKKPTPTPSPGANTYIVRAGDSMYAIAARFGVTLGALKAANPQITNPDMISIGQVLNIPTAK